MLQNSKVLTIFILFFLTIGVQSQGRGFLADEPDFLSNSKRILSYNDNHYQITSPLLGGNSSIKTYNVEYKSNEDYYPQDSKTNSIMKKLQLSVHYQSKSVLRVKLTAVGQNRWEVPDQYPFPTFKSGPTSTPNDSDFSVEVTEAPFEIVIKRKSTGEAIWNSAGMPFLYSDLYLDFGTHVPTPNIYGFGERNYKFKMGPTGLYTIWARDKPDVVETGNRNGHVYGHHPVYLMKEKSQNWHIAFFRSSNAMEIEIRDGKTIRYRVAGGIIDLVFFLGDKMPETPIKMYHDYIGKWVMMPFWAMGYHQSRWGYRNLGTLKHVVGKFRELDIPIDVIWSDLDYMQDKEDFTINQHEFNPKDFCDFLKDKKIHWVPIIDAGVARDRRQGPGYSEGIRRGVFIKNKDGNPLTGTVWPGASHYVDWFHPNAISYWGEMLDHLHQKVPFSGIWLDMNEPTNFVSGEVGREWETSRYDRLPYTPGGGQLKGMTISLDAKHSNGAEVFNTHDLFGMMESQATYMYLKKNSPLPFILTRSSAFGAGQFAAHWTGDNSATWDFLRFGTTGVFNFGIFGMPYTGADICGFMSSTTPELCARWYQIGALYPFARNHNHDAARDQEPWALNRPDFEETARKALKLRYSLLKWYYAQFIEKNGTGLVFKPLFFEFPEETTLYEDDSKDYLDRLVILGNSLLVVPVYNQHTTKEVTTYFPRGTWYDLFTGAIMHKDASKPAEMPVPCQLGNYIPAFLRGGKIIQMQDVHGVQWSKDLGPANDFIIGFKEVEVNKFEAEGFTLGLGNYSSDEDVTKHCIEKNCVLDITAYASKVSNGIRIFMAFKARSDGSHIQNVEISSVKLYGLKDMITALGKTHLEAAVRGAKRNEKGQPMIASVEVLNGGESVTLKDLSQKASSGFTLQILLE